MSLRQRLEHALGVGPTDDPRRIAVSGRKQRPTNPVVSVSGARVRVTRSGRDGEIQRFVGWCHRRGIAMELADGETDELWLDGVATSPAEARGRL